MFDRAEMNTPMMTLELRIQPLIRQIVQHMILTEGEATSAIEDAVNSAVTSFNWREQIRKEVEQTLQHEVRKVLENITRQLTWDEEIRAQFKKSVIRALQTEEPR
jgi:hypothetical protein